ncbi:MAG: rhodanese-like domain-containing protein, partial [Actinomycetota bacterium]
RMVADGAVILDGRSPVDFARGHLAGAVNVGLEGRYAEFAGSVIQPDIDVVLVVEPGFEREARTRLARIGFDRVVGHLADPLTVMADHPDRVRRASRLTAADFADRRRAVDNLQVIDVRNPGEVADGTIDGSVAIPVGQLPARLDELDPNRPTVVFCAGGYRSSVAASVVRAAGFEDVSDVLGGFAAWRDIAEADAD